MTAENIGCYIYGKEDIRLEKCPIPEPGPAEVQLAIQRVGICGTDASLYKHGGISDHFTIPKPTILGHEPSGIVTKVGETVSHLKVGDRVAIEPGVPCHHCYMCLNGPYNKCKNFHFAGFPPHNGSMSHYTTHDADFCFKIPDTISFEEAAAIETLSIGTSACKDAGVILGQSILVCGAGPIGICTMLAAKANGAEKVCITDKHNFMYRLELAKKMGADFTILVESDDHSKEIGDRAVEFLGCRPEIVMECSGTQAGLETAIQAVEATGTVELIGIPAHQVKLSIPVIDVIAKSVNMKGMMSTSPKCYDSAFKLVAAGMVDLKPLVTHVIPLADAHKAFDMFIKRTDGALKVLIDCSKEESKP